MTFAGYKLNMVCRWQDFIVTEIDTQGNLVELSSSKISSANEDDKDGQTINRNEKHKETMRSKECSEEKSTLVERETPFLMQVRLHRCVLCGSRKSPYSVTP